MATFLKNGKHFGLLEKVDMSDFRVKRATCTFIKNLLISNLKLKENEKNIFMRIWQCRGVQQAVLID